MSKKKTRHKQILEFLALKERLGVEELAKILDMTSMTIRRDLAEMERSGTLIRTHGGCVPASTVTPKLSLGEERDRHPKIHAIVRAAIGLIDNHKTIYLDADKITIHLARLLPLNRKVRIVTNNLQAALELFVHKHQGKSLDAVILGGELAAGSLNLVGEMAPMRLTEFCIDVAILGADAIDPQRGEFSKTDVPLAAVSRMACIRAQRTLVLADHTKFGKHGLSVVGSFGPNVSLVTDQEIDPADRKLVESTGANIVMAEV